MTERYVGAWPVDRPHGLATPEAVALGYTLRTRHDAFRRSVIELAPIVTKWSTYIGIEEDVLEAIKLGISIRHQRSFRVEIPWVYPDISMYDNTWKNLFSLLEHDYIPATPYSDHRREVRRHYERVVPGAASGAERTALAVLAQCRLYDQFNATMRSVVDVIFRKGMLLNVRPDSIVLYVPAFAGFQPKEKETPS